MAIEGPLRELGIHDVFQLLDLSRKTGQLRVSSELRRNQGVVSFDGGSVVYAEIRSNPHRMGDLLVRAGKVNEDDLNRALEMQSRGEKQRLGEILVQIGALTRRDLEHYVHFQIEEVVFEVMSWREGYFSFVEGPLQHAPAGGTVRIPTEALLMEGARRIDEWSRIERKIPHLGIVPALAQVPTGAEGRLDLLPPEWEVLASIDGARDLRGIAGVLVRSEFDVAKTVFGLASAGVLDLVDPGLGGSARSSAGFADAVSRAESALIKGDVEAARAAAEDAMARQPHEPSVHLLLGRAHLAADRFVEAEEHLRRALRLDPQLQEAHLLLGESIILQGRLAEGADWWERWLTLNAQAGKLLDGVDDVRRAVDAAQTLAVLVRRPRVR